MIEVNEGAKYPVKFQIAQTRILNYLGAHKARDDAFNLARKHLFAPVATANPSDDEKAIGPNASFAEAEMRAALAAYVADYKTTTPEVRQYLAGVQIASQSNMQDTIDATFKEMTAMMGKSADETDPFVGVETPAAGAAPNVKNYPGGATDPAYIAALAEWLPKKKATLEFNAAKKNHSYNKVGDAVAEFGAACPELKPITDVMAALKNAWIGFLADGSTEPCVEAMALTDALDAYGKKLSQSSTPAYYYIFLNSKGNDYSYSNLSYAEFYKQCEKTKDMVLVTAFQDYIATVDVATVDNAKVRK